MSIVPEYHACNFGMLALEGLEYLVHNSVVVCSMESLVGEEGVMENNLELISTYCGDLFLSQDLLCLFTEAW